MPGWFANGRADKERLGGNARDRAVTDPKQPTGSGFRKREGFTRKLVNRVTGAIIDNTTGRITNSKIVRGISGAKSLIAKGKCVHCKAPLRGNRTYARDFGAWEEQTGKNAVVCSRKCAIKVEASAYDNIQKHMDKLGKENANRGHAVTHAQWLKITGGIQYDDEGKRIW